MKNEISIIPLINIGEITQKNPLEIILEDAILAQKISLQEEDILVVTQKIVSKSEGRIIDLSTIKPSPFALKIALASKKDPRYIEVVLQESKRIVRHDHGILITETKHGFICANAGVDASNMSKKNVVSLLPSDPDTSAATLRLYLGKNIKKLAVIISDTWGRPWREGQVNVAIGCSGLKTMIDYRGRKDSSGLTLQASLIAIADEIASAAELVMGKVDAIPAAIIRGYQFRTSPDTARSLIRNSSLDMFR